MSKISWDEMNRATDTQQAFGTFHKHLIEMYNTHFPKISINGNITTESYGWLKIWKNSIKQKTKLYIKLKKVHSALNNDLYKKKLQEKITAAYERCWKHHYHDVLVKYKNLGVS